MREMKDSGIEWIGAIPAMWQIHPLYYYFCERKCRNTLGKENNLLSLSYGRIIRKDINTVDGLLPENYNGYNIIEKGDIVLRLTDLQNDKHSLRTGLVREHGIITSAYITIKANCELVPEFFQYLLHSYDVMKVLYNMGSGVRQGLNFSELSKMPLISPDMLEQKRIADFLNSKCSDIDAISADIQKEIEILEQYKRSVITEAVTKGLNPDVEMKDSSVEWVGIIPASWTSSRLGYETYIRARLGWKGLKADEYVDEGYAFISAFNIQNNKLVWTPLNYITKERYDESPEIKLHIGDVIIVKDGAGIGKCARIDSLPMGETAPNSSIGVITPLAKLNYRYLAYYLQSAIFNNLILKLLNGMGVPHLTQEVLNKTPILLPPKQEQVRIANFLDSKCCEIDSAIETKKKQIDILDAYKKSLIYEYVTGKKEVPVQN